MEPENVSLDSGEVDFFPGNKSVSEILKGPLELLEPSLQRTALINRDTGPTS